MCRQPPPLAKEKVSIGAGPMDQVLRDYAASRSRSDPARRSPAGRVSPGTADNPGNRARVAYHRMYRAARAAIVEPAGTAGEASMISKLSLKK
jgi:hypothetical protein